MFSFPQTNLIWFAYLRLSLIAVQLGKSIGINTESVSSLSLRILIKNAYLLSLLQQTTKELQSKN